DRQDPLRSQLPRLDPRKDVALVVAGARDEDVVPADPLLFEHGAASRIGVDHGGRIELVRELLASPRLGLQQRYREAFLLEGLGEVIAGLAATGDRDALTVSAVDMEPRLDRFDVGRPADQR